MDCMFLLYFLCVVPIKIVASESLAQSGSWNQEDCRCRLVRCSQRLTFETESIEFRVLVPVTFELCVNCS